MIKKFPKTRYQGSKLKMLPFLRDIFLNLEFDIALDAFSGTSSVSYLLKSINKKVYSNDILGFNYVIAKALIENNQEIISDEILKNVLTRQNFEYKSVIEDNFKDIYYLDDENIWLDMVAQNIHSLTDGCQKYMLFWALFQVCLSKRPYNLFHRKNLHIRTSDVKRSFGNKATWDKKFDLSFDKFAKEINRAIFNNDRENLAFNKNVFDLNVKTDLVYIDTPYIPQKGSLTNYRDFYHFLEGMLNYDNWEKMIDYNSKNRKLITQYSIWEDKSNIAQGFYELFYKFKDAILVISYREDGVPSIEDIVRMLESINKKVETYYIDYKYALAKQKTREVVLVAK